MEEIEILDIPEETSPTKYLDELISFLDQSTEENSIVIEFKFNKNYCDCKVVKYDVDGSNNKLKQKTFSNIKTVTTDIIEPFLKEFITKNKIVINNVLPDKQNTSDLKVISEHNDMCNIQGMDEKEINRLSELIEQKSRPINNQQQMNELGLGNIVAFIISILIVGTIILGMLIPNFWK